MPGKSGFRARLQRRQGAIWGGSLDEWTTGKVAERFVQQGLLAAGHDQHDLRQAIGDMNQRLRYAAELAVADRRGTGRCLLRL